jgi:Asp-tRNA(Asn)/Glu-tRNA(Gln) amidotransferase A subunit family amidase
VDDLPDPGILRLTATEAGAAIREGRLDVRRYAQAALKRIAERDGDLMAWAFLDPDLALRQAAELAAVRNAEPLHGIPVGIKDVIDTFDMPTSHNSPLFAGNRPAADAPVVEMLRAAGALVLGKTETTEFAAAGRNPRTRNPYDLERTSGGSSAGSAAAVADLHVPLAIGTQTGGSTMRPASFCGVYAFKPTWGAVSREGVRLFSASFDTVSWFARSVADLDLLADVFSIGPAVATPPSAASLRVAFCRSPQWASVEPPMRAAFAEARDSLRDIGAEVIDLELPPDFGRLNDVYEVITKHEGGVAFRNLCLLRKEELHEDFRQMVESSAGMPVGSLREAYDLAARCRQVFDAIAADFDVIVAPGAAGEAPKGPHPGSPALNLIWSTLQAPCINLPRWRSSAGLPLGLTLTSARFADRRLLAVAAALDRALADRKAASGYGSIST